jgi:hypothetical protein
VKGLSGYFFGKPSNWYCRLRHELRNSCSVEGIERRIYLVLSRIEHGAHGVGGIGQVPREGLERGHASNRLARGKRESFDRGEAYPEAGE